MKSAFLVQPSNHKPTNNGAEITRIHFLLGHPSPRRIQKENTKKTAEPLFLVGEVVDGLDLHIYLGPYLYYTYYTIYIWLVVDLPL